jgi:hypothetical protein
MKRVYSLLLAATVSGAMFTSCQDQDGIDSDVEISSELASKLRTAGFSSDDVIATDGGYLVEGDIFMTPRNIDELGSAKVLHVEQYSTNNLVSTSGSRNITMYAPTGRKGYSTAMLAGLDEAISRYNAQGLEITFSRITSSNSADIVMKRLSKRDERRGVLGSAGFPTSSGEPYGQILMSGILESSYGLSTDGIATIIGHEMGHCIGMRHTDYFNRSISCGGAADNEGDAGIGANHIPGTATGADTSGNGSWMLACTDGSDRPFTNDDQTALDYLY